MVINGSIDKGTFMSELNCKTVALTGVTGFVGRHILPWLLEAGFKVRVLVRDRDRLTLVDQKMKIIEGDLSDEGALAELVAGADCVMHLVGIIFEKASRGQTFESIHEDGVKRLVKAAKHAGVKRWVHMSALGARASAGCRYLQTKWAGEEAVRGSGMDFTIFRPSVIHGHDGELMEMVRGFWCRLMPPFVPYFGAGMLGTEGSGLVQPVYVEDVARCFVNSVNMEKTVGETYPLGGPDQMTWPEFYAACKVGLPGAKNKFVVGIPAWKGKIMAKFPGMPFNEDQVIMSQGNSICDKVKAETDFDFKMAEFGQTYAQYVEMIG